MAGGRIMSITYKRDICLCIYFYVDFYIFWFVDADTSFNVYIREIDIHR